MNIIEAEVIAVSIRAERDEKAALMGRLMEERNCLPRNEKKRASELLVQINALQHAINKLRVQLIHADSVYQKKEVHGIWETAVLTIWGQDGLTACRAQMRQERIKREAAS
jgi:hypothetical protein